MNYLRDYKINKNLLPLADVIYELFKDRVEASRSKPLNDYQNTLALNAVRCFVGNMAYFCHKDCNTVPLMFRTEYYSRDLIYNGRNVNRKVSHKYTIALLKFLAQENLITIVKGGVVDWEINELTGKVQPMTTSNSKCILCEELWSSVLEVNSNPEAKTLKDVIRVRNKDKRTIQKKLSEVERKMTKNLLNWNKMLVEKEIELDGAHYEVQGYKVFNNSSFKLGGRTYLTGLGENMDLLRCARRSRIKVDGEPTVEIDYKALHPRIIAEIEGVDLKDQDPYAISLDGYDDEALRDLAKVAFMALVGSKTKAGAIAALNDHIRDDKKKDKNEHEYDRSNISMLQAQGKLKESIDTKTIINLVLDRNGHAKEWWHKEAALRLQNIDSNIMDICINHFTQNDKFILPIHDSMIVLRSDLEEGKRVMEDAYEYILGSKHNCKLKVIDYYGEDDG